MSFANNKIIIKNTVMLYIRMLLIMAISLYTSRIILSILGIVDYGIYNLVGGFVSLFSFLSSALVSTVQRYFNVALGNNDQEKFKRIYSMSVNMFAIFSLLLLLVGETVGVWFVKNHLNIPVGREQATIYVFHLSLITLIVNIFRTIDTAAIIANEKMNVYAYVGIIEVILKLLIVYMLKIANSDKLIIYVISYLSVSVFLNIVYKVYCNRNFKTCRYSMIWDKALFRELIGFSGLNLVESGFRTGVNQGINFLINKYYSVAINATQGISAQIYNAINTFVTNFQTAFKPQLIKTYVANEMQAHYTLLYRTSKFSFYLMILIVIPIVFNLNNILNIWLVEVPPYTEHFCIFILMAYLADSISAPLQISIFANGNIKGIKITNSVISLIQLIICYFLLKNRVAPYISAVITLVTHIMYFIISLYYANRICSVSIYHFAKNVLLHVCVVFSISIVIPYLIHTYATNFWSTILIVVIDFLWTLTIIYLFGLKKEEKIFIRNYFVSKLIK